MAKKKTAKKSTTRKPSKAKRKKATKKAPAKKSKARKPTTAKKPTAKKKKAAKKRPVKKSPARKSPRTAAKTKSAVKKFQQKSAKNTASSSGLGRAKVTGDEKLFLLFHNDYHARQVFDFLRVQTVRELEEYSPEEIVRLLSKPIRISVDQIRRRLAEKNRCLKGDKEFAQKIKTGK